MRKKYIFGKKLYISVLTSILVLLTTVATTFAWVGVFANSTFEKFDFAIRSNDLKEYSIEISLDGVNFYDSINFDDIKEQLLLNKFNDTNGPINRAPVSKIFEEQAVLHADDIAVICDDKFLTYKELNEKANSLAHHLIEKGVKPNDIVAIMTNRSLETIVCMIAILKAGAAFLNIDPTYPIERTEYYINDSKIERVLIHTL